MKKTIRQKLDANTKPTCSHIVRPASFGPGSEEPLEGPVYCGKRGHSCHPVSGRWFCRKHYNIAIEITETDEEYGCPDSDEPYGGSCCGD
jgi:hypothetical protein